ncbi:MAG TPA: family 43 glycosylhydrolase [Candidatus Eisenbergiella stercorigallinarum]|uniref:Family 43 glycosylhydrolase n=1 Tax=Candidatus Eisenbergiella stercorigallinarum TaxID=2838557 RepID=A0A9D2QZE7_9FIRM|nr:family 43 glycosylhydrolase [Candidatus Eisenbergiella intestinipullorum]HJD30997.1 family 43 glycosylhydrolase [Candidatus Eisenbergiella stercorigallinarum]
MEGFCTGTRAGWEKFEGNPVLGGSYGVCFDISVLETDGGYRMYFSWRTRKSIAVTDSRDGFSWSEPEICLAPRPTPQGWENDLNRPAVVYREGIYHMWYTGQFHSGDRGGTSHIFYAVSEDGIHFQRKQDEPVLWPEEPWEKSSLMCPDVMWDEEEQLYKMWYSGGEKYEPNAIGYAVSKDGIHWKKRAGNPVFQADPENPWEQHKAAGCHVIKLDGEYLMFYIGYQNEDYAQIGLAKSKDGVSGWMRHPENPIIAPDPGAWDGEACYKPYAIYDGNRWMLWYNGRKGHVEQIGVAVHEGWELGFQGD